MEQNRGSEWRKWDLHIHSPYSNISGNGSYKGCSDNDFINKIKESEISVVGLTNYFKFDDREFNLADNLRKNDISVFMNLEVRLTNQNDDDQLSDYHIIFSDELTKQEINNFLLNLDVTLGDRTSKAIFLNSKEEFESAAVNFNDLCKVLENEGLNLKGKYLKAMLTRGHGNSAINKKRTDTVYKEILRKTDIIMNSSNKMENLINDKEYLINAEPKEYVRPLLQSSDAHSLSYIGSREFEGTVIPTFTWIKSDITFEGLKQIKYEPDQRISYGINRPFTKEEYLVIDRIEYQPEKTIYFNDGLNAIIGGRSAGKSTLLNTIAKYQNNDKVNIKNINFLETDYKVFWRDGECAPEREVEFIPQDYMINLSENKEELNKLVREIIIKKNMDSQETLFLNKNSDNSIKIQSNLDEYFNLCSKKSSIIKPEGDKEGVLMTIEGISDSLSSIRKNNNFSEDDEKIYNDMRAQKESINESINNLEKDIKNLTSLKELKFYINNDLGEFQGELRKELDTIISSIIEESEECLNNRIDLLIKETRIKKEDCDKKIKLIENSSVYIKGRKLEEKNSEINRLERHLDSNKEVLREIEEYEKNIEYIDRKLKDLSDEIVNLYIKYIYNLKQFESDFVVEEDELKIIIERKIVDFSEKIDFLNGRSKFNLEFIEKFNKVLESYDEDDIESFLKSIFNETKLSFNKSKNKEDFIREMFTNNWFKYNFNIVFQNDQFDEMSQGKKSFVILTLLLEFSEDKKPVLIDQPEDSLDNRAIYSELREYLLKTKRKRQIILVTHNPNIVVGADAENIIVANQHSDLQKNRDNIKFEYINGSLEDNIPRVKDSSFMLESSGIRQHIFDVLEGGVDAFSKREQKYQRK